MAGIKDEFGLGEGEENASSQANAALLQHEQRGHAAVRGVRDAIALARKNLALQTARLDHGCSQESKAVNVVTWLVGRGFEYGFSEGPYFTTGLGWQDYDAQGMIITLFPGVKDHDMGETVKAILRYVAAELGLRRPNFTEHSEYGARSWAFVLEGGRESAFQIIANYPRATSDASVECRQVEVGQKLAPIKAIVCGELYDGKTAKVGETSYRYDGDVWQEVCSD